MKEIHSTLRNNAPTVPVIEIVWVSGLFAGAQTIRQIVGTA